MARNHQVHRLAIVAKDAAQAARSLTAFLDREATAGVVQGRVLEHAHAPVFVFSGQGSQWAGMGAQLLEREPVFRRALEACDVALRPYTGWSVVDALRQKADPRTQSIDVIQPTLFAMQVGLAALWRALGVEPSLVIGHSMGEIAAAHLAGILTLEDAACIVCSRSQLLKRTSGQGGMLGVELSFADAERTIAQFGGRVGVAVSNSPTSTVLSGEPELLEQLKADLERRQIFCRFIAADVAGHSPQLDPLLPDFARAIAGIRPNPAAKALLFSTVAGKLLEPAAFDAAYWVRNLREPVRFSSALSSVLEQGYDTFLEISPHPILLGPIQQIFSHVDKTGSVHSSLRRDEDAQFSLRTTLAELHVAGHAVDLAKSFGARQPFAALPTYVWQRERFDADAGDIDRVPEKGRRAAGSDGALLGPGLASALHARTWFFESALSLQRLPYFADHKVRDAAILPGAAYVDMALTAAGEVLGSVPLCLQDVRFERALRLSPEGTTRVQLAVHTGARGASFQFFGAEGGESSWTALATLSAGPLAAPAPQHVDLDALRSALPVYPVERHFQVAQAHGIEYGPGFRGIQALWLGEDSALAKVALPSCVPVDPQRQRASAALLDACWQAFGALVLRPSANDRAADAFLPVAIQRIQQFRPLGTEVWVHAQLRAAASDAQRQIGDVALCDARGEVLMQVDGLELQRLAGEARDATLERWLFELRWQETPSRTRDVPAVARKGEVWLVFADRNGRASSHVLAALRASAARCIEVRAGSGFEALDADRFTIDPREPEHFARVLGDSSLAGIVHLWSLDAGGTDLSHAQELGSLSVAHLVQALARAERPAPLWIVTQASQHVLDADRVTPAQAPVWALARVLRYEHPELATRCIDLSASPNDAEWSALVAELSAHDAEDQLALRGGQRFGMRLLRGASSGAQPAKASRAANFRLDMDRPGILDHLRLRAAERTEPGPDEVEIEVCAAALNFLDVLKALGNMPGQTAGSVALGLECAGRISKLGANVRGLALGQEVVAVTTSTRTSISQYVRTHAALAVPKPQRLSFEQAVTVPVAFLTAQYALEHVGRLAAGERVLIHNAAGGVGLAAIAVARARGAEIFATAGNEQKRELLAELGVSYVGDSRSLAFADEIRARTSGEGVDVVLNALAGEAITEGLRLLRPQGRFLEIGKRDIYDNQQLGMLPFRAGLTFAHVDIAALIHDRPRLIGELLGAILARVERGELEPLPATLFPVSEAPDAFRHMAQAAHVGKVVLTFDDPALPNAVQPDPAAPLATGDGWYVVSGGLSGLGLTTACWLVEQGARQLVLLGRKQPSTDAQRQIAQLEAAGVRVLVRSCDVGDLAQLRAALEGVQPLRGVVHSAGVIEDGMTLQLTAASLRRVMHPKLLGAWNLHQLTRDLPLDFFVMYSSGAATLGSPGQGNYAAANAFLDALAHFRRDAGLPALSINWGAWSEVGLAVRPDRAERLGERGLGSMTNREGLRVLEKLLREGALNTTVFPAANWHTWTEFYPVAAKLPVFETLLRESNGSQRTAAQSELQRILDAEPAARAQHVERYLLEQVSRVLKVARNKQLDPELALTRLGIDSLMALELKNRIEADLQVLVPVSKILLGPSARKLAHDVLDKLPVRASAPDPTLAEVAALSDAQVDALLGELLG
ncbi:MAG TPA: SDR family NAD(P)-dependent oxidoreductase [Polyangiales bacterium]|nr:SDR family NAD(P)-dependent oxidoreductase [Polyangiales bacterium]